MYEKTYHTQVLKKDEVKKTKKGFSWKRILVIFLSLAFIFGVIFVIRHPRLQVTNIEVLGTQVLDVEDVVSFTKEQLVGRSLWILPKTSIFLIDESSLKKAIQNKFSRIETISVSRDNFHSLTIDIKEFDAKYLWCSQSSVEDCYFMDNQGIVYSNAPVFSGTAYPKIITNKEVLPLPFLVMDISEVARITMLNDRLSAIGITPVNFKYISDREMIVDFLHNKTISNIKIDPKIPTETTLEYVFSAIRTEPFSSLFQNSEKNLLYIDVRFPSKVVYKFE